MSFKLFDQGLSAEEINRRKTQQGREDYVTQQLKRWSESERVLSTLRSIKASQEQLTELEMKVWREATGQKSYQPQW